MRFLRATLTLGLLISPQAALACGGMVSPGGRAEMLGFQALLRWEGGTEELEVSIGYQTRGEKKLAWMMPLPSAPKVDEAEGDLVSEAFEITEPPVEVDDSGDEGAGAPPVTGALGVDIIAKETVSGLRFVTLGGRSAGEVRRWMTRHGFAFHDRQEPVLQSYLDRGWVVVAAKFTSASIGQIVPIRFRFATPDPVYPLAITGAGHEEEDVDLALFVLTPFRPASTTYQERIVRPDPQFGFGSPGKRLELRYSAPLRRDADRMGATPETWLTRYEGNLRVEELTQDLVLSRASDQSVIDYADIEDGESSAWVLWVAIPLALVVLAIWISVRMARSRRAEEAARMPSQAPPL